MLTLANAFARKATELDPSLGIPLDVILAGEGDGDTVSERALGVSAVPAPEGDDHQEEK